MIYPYLVFYCSANVVICLMVAPVEGNNVTDGKNSANNVQIAMCPDLNYQHEQQCYITDFEKRTCLRKKASSISYDSCPPDRQLETKGTDIHMCAYSEICAFTDETFACDASYNCTIEEDSLLNCTKDLITFFTKNCTPSLLYCTYAPEDYDGVNGCIYKESYIDVFRDECIKQYEGSSTNHSIWFYVEFFHLNNETSQYGILKSTYDPNWNGDRSLLCQSQNEQIAQDFTLTISLASVGGILFIMILYALYEGRNKWKEREKNLYMGVENFVANHLKRFIDSNESSIFNNKEPTPFETCDILSEIESLEDISSLPDTQTGETTNAEAPIPTNNDTASSALMPDNSDTALSTTIPDENDMPSSNSTCTWDNPSYIAKRDTEHHNDSTTSHVVYLPKFNTVQTENANGSTLQTVDILESSLHLDTSQETDCNRLGQVDDSDNKFDDCVSTPGDNSGAYMSKNLVTEDEQI